MNIRRSSQPLKANDAGDASMGTRWAGKMIDVEHVSFGWLHAPPHPPACCHCLLVRCDGRTLLVDTGIGLEDIASPEERIGAEAIGAAGFRFVEADTAVRQLERRGIAAAEVTDIVLTHADPDHAGGLSDFPQARVHISAEELENVARGNPRYGAQFAHGPKWIAYEPSEAPWFGLPSRRVRWEGECEVRLVPLFGHTLGHCGVAVRSSAGWILHVGDAYYLRAELTAPDHPVTALAQMRADDDAQRRASLDALRRLASRHGEQVELFGYHDVAELPLSIPRLGHESS